MAPDVRCNQHSLDQIPAVLMPLMVTVTTMHGQVLGRIQAAKPKARPLRSDSADQ